MKVSLVTLIIITVLKNQTKQQTSSISLCKRVFPNCVGCEIIDNRPKCVACRVGMGLNLDKPVEQRDCTPCQLRSCQCTENYKMCSKCAFNSNEDTAKSASSQFGKVCEGGNPPDYNTNNLGAFNLTVLGYCFWLLLSTIINL